MRTHLVGAKPFQGSSEVLIFKNVQILSKIREFVARIVYFAKRPLRCDGKKPFYFITLTIFSFRFKKTCSITEAILDAVETLSTLDRLWVKITQDGSADTGRKRLPCF